ncbi:acetamidase/formamidase family protein [Salinicoccus sp. HZC-1]
MLNSAPVQGNIGGIVDIPNVCCTLSLLKEIQEKNPRLWMV